VEDGTKTALSRAKSEREREKKRGRDWPFQLLPLFIPRALSRVTVNCFELAAMATTGRDDGEAKENAHLPTCRDQRER